MNEVHGGSPWGASTLAGPDGMRQPSAIELSIAEKHAVVFGTKVMQSVATPTKRAFKVCIVYYSMYGHIKRMADEIASSIKEAGVAVDMFQAPELLSTEVLEKMGAGRK